MLKTIYTILRSRYGKQNWWPVTPPGEYHPRYTGGPKTERDQIEIAIGAVLAQNTTWSNVEKALAALHRRNLVDVDAILKTPRSKLAQLIRASRYYNQKALKLKALAELLKKHPVKSLQAMATPGLRDLFLAVSGIGPETADSILLYAFRKPVFVVDAYTRRIFSRVGLCPKDVEYHELQRLFHAGLRKNERMFNEYHALLVVHGKDVCRPKPLCAACVLSARCAKILE